MVFWSRIRSTRFEYFSSQYKRWYSPVSRMTLVDHITDRRIAFLENSGAFIGRMSNDQYTTLRSFAAPVQVKPKPEVRDLNGPRINAAITSSFVRLVTDEGHSVVSRHEALDCAMKLNLDLVEVDKNAKPPVCKIMDFHKEKYKQQVKEKDRSKVKSEVTLRKGDFKEVRFTGKTEQKDLQMKADMVKRLMDRGYRVKIEDVAFVESGPRVEKRQAFVVVRHVKFGAPKKNPGKKAGKIMEATNAADKATITLSMVNGTSDVKMPEQTEKLEAVESGSDMEDEFLSDQEKVHSKSSFETATSTLKEVLDEDASPKQVWRAFTETDNLGEVFDFDTSGNGGISSFTEPSISDISELLSRQQPVTSVVNGSTVNKNQEIGRKATAGENVVPSAYKSVHDSMKSKQGFASENPNTRDIDPKTRSQQMKSIERSGRVIESERKLSAFSCAVQRNNVNKPRTANAPEPLQDPINSRWPTQSGVNTTASSEKKLPHADNSSIRNWKQLSVNESSKRIDANQEESASSYGIFSAKTVSYRKESSPMNIAKHPNSGGVSLNPNSPQSNVEPQKQDSDKTKTGGWEVFSRDPTRTSQHENSESQVKVQRQ